MVFSNCKKSLPSYFGGGQRRAVLASRGGQLVAEIVQLGVDDMQIAFELTTLPLPGQSILVGLPALLPIFFRPFQIGFDIRWTPG
jgi:hypothetical protein